jgi:hypothetical protein
MNHQRKIAVVTVLGVIVVGYALFDAFITGVFTGGTGLAGARAHTTDYLRPIIILVIFAALVVRFFKK